MGISVHKQDFGTFKEILVFPDHYVAMPYTFTKDHTLATTVGDKKIVKAGTIYPSNDANAIGVVFRDVDVTKDDANGAIIIHGFVKTAALPDVPSTAAKGALKGIQFLPLENKTATLNVTALSIATGEATGTVHTVELSMDGAVFSAGAETLSNWTITGESTTKVSVESIAVINGGTAVLVTLKNTGATAAGSVTMVPKAAATTTGNVPSTAATIVTVA